MTTKEVLIAARAKIAEPENWTKRAYARMASGEPTSEESGNAVCWCASGAIFSVTAGQRLDAVPARTVLLGLVGDMGIPGFNDTSTHAEVLALFDKAIESAA